MTSAQQPDRVQADQHPSPQSRTSLQEDERWMVRALQLALSSVGLASPNPAVGCVLVKDGTVVGEGFHAYDRLDHAEVVALRQAGEKARGATAYVTLEPCCHTGRTGPCTEALIQAGVARVVAATGDPNPQVSGKGLARLRDAGITAEEGVLRREAQEQNDAFARYIRTGMPFVTLKAGVSFDGRIAPPPGTAPIGRTTFITGEESRAEVQRMRHAADAIMTGIHTILNDDPLLTDRSGLARRRPLLRVVLDSALRLPLDSQLVRTAKDDVLIFCTIPVTDRQRALEAMGVRVERVESSPEGSRVSLRRVLERLGEMQMTSVLLEAGSQLNSSALTEEHVDRLALFYAPVFLGSVAVPLLGAVDAPQIHPDRITVDAFGRDLRVLGYLRDPWL
ncbi:bifunctional diaminohydroxyphosphoribosylaminopyrimidine deaminase/5-amino-6-(5-phosphoribosylamino)uracil reductase RibD [Acidipila sp. 4G-K13]|uniref:Riboflavin biosynthesis protein RibD n=2 Tax=Paracidobacterium acidisoli TaxID=2303751 RepID=A0A372ITD8_9BACT|nr:bifunctional diaminohydroxyphosphoribosylaminopyrimidine deaminase/5-amino-6-(5-phosphoribosylamino)uracil reductase RibD [Paracidobacterium acidisoli]MBT9329630.1 bifunctional diaminohydroxyphosphoribosylaminopyrimidine deaminase/5-amino-6-(5-phosphoribosylamino)uracil reductase RibD [Paracidobacterium acidisoli]